MEEVESLIVGMDKLSIQPGRKWPSPMENQPKLRASLVKKGQLTPLLINPEHEILDGVWRYIEAQALGWTEIGVIIPENYMNACDLLAEAHSTEADTVVPLTQLRVWQIIQALEPLYLERIQERKDAMWGRRRHEPYGEKLTQRGDSREKLAKALGLPGETHIQIIRRINKLATTPNDQQELAKELWKEMMAEQRTTYSAMGILRRDLERQKLVSDVATQRKVFKGIMPVADSLIASLRDIGDLAPEITLDEAKAWATKLRELKGLVTTTQFKLNDYKRDKESKA
jgi:hypothetical protein